MNNNKRSIKSVDVSEYRSVNKILFNDSIDVHRHKVVIALAKIVITILLHSDFRAKISKYTLLGPKMAVSGSSRGPLVGPHIGRLMDCNFVIRSLFKDVY